MSDDKASTSAKTTAPRWSNRPFLAHQRWKQQEAKRKADEARNPELRQQAEQRASAQASVFQAALWLLVIGLLAAKMMTGSWIAHYDGILVHPERLLPATNGRSFTPEELARYDGSPGAPGLYLAIDSVVYDVSAGRKSYGPGGSYHHFAGKDASRAFVTGCFRTHLTHDLRGLSDDDLKSLESWKDFYEKSDKYRRVGMVHHPALDPSSPVPAPCNARSEGGAM